MFYVPFLIGFLYAHIVHASSQVQFDYYIQSDIWSRGVTSTLASLQIPNQYFQLSILFH
jgi:hypothetical protein